MKYLRESESIPVLHRSLLVLLLAVTGLLLMQTTAWSGEQPDGYFPAWQAVSETELDTIRGGFLFSNGVQVDIGIQKAAIVNGIEQFRTQFNATEALQSRLLDEANSVLQLGSGNTLGGLDLTGGSVFIQNTLDNQFLENFTVIDVHIKNLGDRLQQTVPAFPSLQDITIPGIAP
jgi:hypothetical protein